MSALRARFDDVRDRIARAAGRARRDPASVRLVAVSKTFPIDAVRELADLGQTDFGENKVQEALPKMAATAALSLTWHLVGHLQSNKARKAAEQFAWIHSLDSAALVSKIEADGAGRRLDGLIQVNLADEPTKHGVRPDEIGDVLEAASHGDGVLRVRGLMALPPALAAEQARPYFATLRRLKEELAGTGRPSGTLTELSMGMSHDFEVAIEEGATIVRVGSALFGPRGGV